ncbi:efflux transporter outer membrane subunit [Acinetobacter calcoaceticus]|uniref:efflux transporter outer membrane subunit n=1 Tax=Acinetobacter calcoaceticus TaxID=471 RepID=UPI001E381448|nr:TolC family protein [Acinetobacter calcoaceticus]UGQ31026.1 TolC family protein [Acinetobacter calcoaceticus]
MLSRSIVLLPILTSILTACTVGPNYKRPSISLPEQYLGAPLNSPSDETKADIEVWWKSFNDPQLTRYVTLALKQNLDLAQAYTRVTQAQAGLSAVNASLRPIGTVDAQAAKAYQSVETPLGQVLNSMPNFDRHGSSYEANLSATWELDIFGGLRRDRESALANYQASNAGASAVRLMVAAQTANLYINIRGLQSRLDIAQQQLQTQQKLLSIIQLLNSKGLASEFQVKQAKANVAQVQVVVPALGMNLDIAMNALDVMLGTVPGTHRAELAEVKPIPVIPNITETGTPRDLLRRRPDLIMAERQLAASNAGIGSAIAEYYPKVSLGGLIGSATTASGNLFSSGANQAAGLLGLRWRLFDFGRINAEIRLAKAQEAEKLAAYQLAVLHAAEDVENSLSTLSKRQEQLVALQDGENALKHAQKIAVIAYQKGINSQIEVLQANSSALQFTDRKVQVQTDSALAAVAVYKSLGGGWQPQKF